MANTTGGIRTVDEILGDEVQFSLKAGRSYIILSLSCVETLTKQWKDKLQEVWELQELNEHLEDKLKEKQETVDPIKPLDKDDDYTFLCSKCKGELFCGDVVRDHYCPTCGKRVNWETAEV